MAVRLKIPLIKISNQLQPVGPPQLSQAFAPLLHNAALIKKLLLAVPGPKIPHPNHHLTLHRQNLRPDCEGWHLCPCQYGGDYWGGGLGGLV
jgi:hypothetical protein